jgi:N-methylhydantoinase A
MGGVERRGLALGVDIGGTFTDLALLDRASGEVRVGKVLTNYRDLSAGVIDGVKGLIGGDDGQSAVAAASIGQVIHGTTLATNALIERRGARTALIVTRGFRDILELARESRFDIYDIDIEVPSPLIAREDVFEITERLDAAGQVVTELAKDEIARIAGEIERRGIAAVAVCLLHAYRNPMHETEVARLLSQAAPGLPVTLSSQVMPDIREYERASTTVANAYVQPALAGYLAELSRALQRLGVTAPLNIIASDGGTLSVEVACRFPVRVVESGPAGGAIATAYIAAQAGIGDAIGFDMGGTTAKFCLIEAGEPTRSTTFEVGRVYRFAKGSGLPLKVPVIELIEIGAGGGSVAQVNKLGRLQVGPESAGAAPGPACYGLGGEQATVTDADLVLGMLDPDHFLGGRLKLDRSRAENAIRRTIAEPLGLSLQRAAAGIQAIVNDSMARAAKVHCMERGKDPRDFALLPYGGAGPVHGYELARTLGITRMILPMRAGVMSALGFLAAPPSFELVRGDATPLATADPDRIGALLEGLEIEGRSLVETAGVASGDITVLREAAMRYVGQSFELNVPVPTGAINSAVLGRLESTFLELYLKRYHRLNPNVPLEITGWRVVARGPQPGMPQMLAADTGARQMQNGTRQVYSVERGETVKCAVYDRMALRAGARIEGPAVIEEDESTAFIDAGGIATVDDGLNLIVTLPSATKRAASVSGRGNRRVPA